MASFVVMALEAWAAEMWRISVMKLAKSSRSALIQTYRFVDTTCAVIFFFSLCSETNGASATAANAVNAEISAMISVMTPNEQNKGRGAKRGVPARRAT